MIFRVIMAMSFKFTSFGIVLPVSEQFYQFRIVLPVLPVSENKKFLEIVLPSFGFGSFGNYLVSGSILNYITSDFILHRSI